MSKRPVELFVADILVALDVVNRHTDKIKEPDDLIDDEIICSAMIRQLEIVGEAMKYIVQSEELKDYSDPKWRNVVDFRNIVAHEYFGISYYQVFDIIKVQVPKLEQQIIDFVKRLPEQRLLYLAFDSLKTDLLAMNRHASANYLQHIQSMIKK